MNIVNKAIWKINHIYRRIRDQFVIPDYNEKRRIILSYKKYGAKVFIETGTYMGDTIENCKANFAKLISFELSTELAEKAKQRFLDQPNITIVEGDSGKLLPAYIKDIKEPCLFWLDGHYSWRSTPKGDTNTPVINELKAILSHPKNWHVILIDNARCFTGKDDYPTIKEVKKLVSKLGKNLSVSVKRDIIRITPPLLW